MKIIGFAGTAKNTGKTTAALDLIHQAGAAGLRMALTSIGYDGEDLDHITGLPKPRYDLPSGMLVATAERCLQASTAGFEELERTSIETILGPVIIARVCRPGLVRVAGPNRDLDLQSVYAAFREQGIDLTLVDGALNRIVPMVGVDGLVLATGAALSDRIDEISAHAAALARLFNLPRAEVQLGSQIEVMFAGGGRKTLATNSLLSQQTAADLGELLQPAQKASVTIPGACDPLQLRRVIRANRARAAGMQIILHSPVHMIAGGSPLAWVELADELDGYKGMLTIARGVPLRYMTVNSFYPRYLGRAGAYEPAWVDSARLLESVRAAVPGLPVLDLRQPPLPDRLALAGLGAR